MNETSSGLIDWFTVAAQGINFLILIGLLKHFLYRPILTAIDAREKRVADQLAAAQQQLQTAATERTALDQATAQFDQQRAALLQQAQTAAQTARQQALDAARAEVATLRTQWQQTLQTEQQQFHTAFVQRTQQTVFNLVRKVLAELADASLEARLVQRLCQQLPQLAAAQLAELQATPALTVRSAFPLAAAEQQAVQQALQALHVGAALQFEQQAGLLSGVEIVSDGHKLAWSVNDYLDELESSLANVATDATTGVTPDV